MLNLHRDKKSLAVNRGEMGRSLVTPGRMAPLRGASAISEMEKKKKKHSVKYITDSFLRFCYWTSQNVHHEGSDPHIIISQNIFHWDPRKPRGQFKEVIYGPLRTYELQKHTPWIPKIIFHGLTDPQKHSPFSSTDLPKPFLIEFHQPSKPCCLKVTDLK